MQVLMRFLFDSLYGLGGNLFVLSRPEFFIGIPIIHKFIVVRIVRLVRIFRHLNAEFTKRLFDGRVVGIVVFLIDGAVVSIDFLLCLSDDFLCLILVGFPFVGKGRLVFQPLQDFLAAGNKVFLSLTGLFVVFKALLCRPEPGLRLPFERVQYFKFALQFKLFQKSRVVG